MKKSFLILGLLILLAVPSGFAQTDSVTVGTVTGAAGTTVDVPVFIRDVSGTPLGLDQPPGSRIQSYSLSVNYPASSVQSVTFTRAGITASLTPAFESSPSSSGRISLLDVFQESTNLIPFTLNGAAPGNQVGVLHVAVPAAAAPGSMIPLTLDVTLTQLANQGGTTQESVLIQNLTLVDGAINLAAAPVPALSPLALALMALALAGVGLMVLKR